MLGAGLTRRVAILALASVWGAAALTPAANAQILGDGKPLSGQINDSALITLEVSDRPLEDVLDHIRDKVGVTIVTMPGTDGRVTINLREVPWRDALKLVAENALCIVTEQSSRIFLVEKPERVTMSFADEDIKRVIESIAKYAKADVIVSEPVVAQVNMVVENQPWRDALDAVVKTYGYFVVEEDRGILRVVDESGLMTHTERRMFELKYLRPKEAYVAKIDTLYAEGGTVAAANDLEKDFPLIGALKSMLSNSSSLKGQLEYLPSANAIVVLDTKPVLDEIGSFIERLDVEPLQVYIDVKFVSTSQVNSSEFALGFDQGLEARLTGSSRSSRLPFNLGPGSFADNLLPGPRPPAAGDIVTSPVTPGVLDFSATSLAVKLLKNDSTAEVVQRPTLVTLNRTPATIFVGETVRYAQAEAAAAQSGGLTLEVREADNSPVQTGFQLLLIPTVVPGTNEVILTVMPESETLSGTSDPNLPGFEKFEVGAGTEGLGQISLPRISQQTIVTNMLLENGQTGVVGGLLQSSVLVDEQKVPVLGDLPFVGNFFRSETARNEERGLMVFVTPWIVRGAEGQGAELDRAIQGLERRSRMEWDSLIGFDDEMSSEVN